MLKTELLLALFATLINVQADNLYGNYQQGAVVAAPAAPIAPIPSKTDNNVVVTITANTVAVVTASAVGAGVVPAPKVRHQHRHDNRQVRHNRHHSDADSSDLDRPARKSRRTHRGRSNKKHVGRSCRAQKSHHAHADADSDDRKHKQHVGRSCRAHKAHHGQSEEGHKHKKHVAHSCNVHKKHGHSGEHKHKKHVTRSCHAHGHGHKKHAGHKMEHPMAHLKKAVAAMPGKGRSSHDSNDFASFEVAKLDILRVTKLDSEHKHDAHASKIDKEFRDAVRRRSEDLKKGLKDHKGKGDVAHKSHIAHVDKKTIKKNCAVKADDHKSKRKIHRHRKHTDGAVADSDEDVRASIKAHRRARKDARKAHRKHTAGAESDEDVRAAKRRARKAARKANAKPACALPKKDDAAAVVEKKSGDDKGVVGSVKDAVKGTGKGVGNIFNSIGKKLGVKSGDSDKKTATLASKEGDLKLNAEDRARLVVDLKAISALDREALQYLDTSCGPVKGLEKKKAKREARRQKKAKAGSN